MRYKIKRLLSYIKYDIPQGFKNLIRFTPLVWQLRWWDSYWLLKLIQKQLEWMEENWVKNTNHEGDEGIKEKIFETIIRIKRLSEEDYQFLYDEHDKKWGEIEFSSYEIPNSKNRRLEITRTNVNTAEEDEQESEEFSDILDRQYELIKEDTEVIFENLKECRKWWD